ncbi:nuclear pore complex protein DDB_G0274915 [Frankliniella occidentalis]|uniref:Nuclear pore complex protein DDB_G0274915 n=1 Tax=Frankliniella occidentalis TaxID=133901 RepID=A0A6J1S8Z2_FRAOC|nr:nuclear pore complex protein DDB_G0274915 [Frankliniella occidentalis]
MFLGFGKRNSTPKRPGTPQESPKTLSSPGLSLAADGPNGGSRSTVQTTAGPLLSSTRFNSILDASTYANVNSPGFTSRVVNCASNGNSYHENSATHQSKYSTVGLFPRVNLGGQSTLSILSPRNSQKVGRTPVRVRIAPPSSNLLRRHSISFSSSEAIKVNSEISKQLLSSPQQSHRKEGSLTLSKNTDGVSSLDNLQEASRKRIFSECQDSFDESKKRRKKTEIPIPNPNNDVYHYRHVRAPSVPTSPPQPDNASQGKRAREKGSPEEQKRQRRKVCNTNNAIFSSLSSSRNLLERLTSQKRKSIDTSRSSSPLTPLSGKQVKESKTTPNVKAAEINLSIIPHKKSEKISDDVDKVGTPISSKVISQRSDLCTREKNEIGEKTVLKDTNQSSTCDYTTKLFRKDVSSHVPRTPTSKTTKQSLWVQAPEVDDLSCSLLSDDSKLDRPERLKSLLARVSGKDKNPADETNPTISDASKESSKGSFVGASLPGNTTLKALSPSSALTVTVSSTCTIMTSATVTSVNGVPSSESSRPPPSMPASVTSTQSSQLQLTTGKSLAGVTSPSAGGHKPESLLNASGVGALTGTSSIGGLKSSTGFTMKSPDNNNSTSQSGSKANTSAELPKATFQFGSSSSNVPTPSNSHFSVTPNVETCAAVSANSNSSPSFSLGSKSDQTTAVASSTFQFSSKQSNTAHLPGPKSSTNQATFSFGSSGNAQTGAANSSFQLGLNGTSSPALPKSSESANSGAPKTTFSFGSSTAISSEAPKSAPQIGTSSNTLEVASKSTFQFASSGQAANVPTVPSFQLGSNVSNSTSSTFQFGSGSNKPVMPATATKTAVQFGSISTGSSEGTKPSFQFGSSTSTSSSPPSSSFQLGSNSGSMVAPNAAVQFGSTSSSGSSLGAKSSFQFGSSNPSMALKPTVQFGSTNNGSSEAPKSAFQFSSTSVSSGNPKPALTFGSSGTPDISKPSMSFGSTGSSKDTFQFGGGSQNSSSANPSFQFGSTAASPQQSNQFGSNAVSPQQSIQFGSNATGAASQSTSSPFAFGSNSSKSVDSSKPSFQFSTSSDKPTFGSSQGSGSAFSQVPQQQSKGAFAFGQPSNAGTNVNEAKNTFTFGSSTPSFGSTSASSPPFGSGSSSATFGSTSSTHSAQPSFGSSALKSNGFNSTPTFGGGSNSGAFSFSANSSSGVGTNAGAGGAFSFGQNQDQASQSFSFNATVTTVPNPSAQAAQTPGLFSVGAGSSSSTRRVVRDARRRR